MSLLLLFPQGGAAGEGILLPQFPLSRRHPIYQPSYTAGLLFAAKAPTTVKEPMHTKEIAVLSGVVTAVGGILAVLGIIPPDVAIGAAGAAAVTTAGAVTRSRTR